MSKKISKGLILLDPNTKKITEPIEDIRAFTSERELNRHFMDLVNKEVQARQLLNKGKTPQFTNNEILKMLVQYLKLKVKVEKSRTGDSFNMLMVLDTDNPAGVWKPFNLEKYITLISMAIEIKDVKKTIADIALRAMHIDPDFFDIEEIKEPPKEIILAPNCVVNLKTMEQYNSRDGFGEYDFLQSLKFNVLPLKYVDRMMLEITRRIHNDWTQGDKDAQTYLKQLEFSSIEGNGRKVYNVLKGDGGNGKSTFLNILENLANPEYAVKLDMQDLMRDNSLKDILPTTKIVLGHDMSTNSKVNSTMLSRFKEFTQGEGFQIEVKYKPNQLCYTNGLKIQNTNSDIAFFENSRAIKRRLIVFNWTDQDFSKLTTDDSEFNLEDLVNGNSDKSKRFYEALIADMFSEMEYFDKFITIQSSVEYTENMIANADQVYAFMNYLKDQDLLVFNKIPVTILYQMYVLWMKSENPGSSPLKRRGFTDRVMKLASQFGYVYDSERTRLSSIPLLDFNAEFLNAMYFDNNINYNRYEMTTTLSKKSNGITSVDVKNFKKRMSELTSNDSFTTKEMLIIRHLKAKGNIEAAALIDSET